MNAEYFLGKFRMKACTKLAVVIILKGIEKRVHAQLLKSAAHIEKNQRQQNKILRMSTRATFWYVKIKYIRIDLNAPSFKKEITKYSEEYLSSLI